MKIKWQIMIGFEPKNDHVSSAMKRVVSIQVDTRTRRTRIVQEAACSNSMAFSDRKQESMVSQMLNSNQTRLAITVLVDVSRSMYKGRGYLGWGVAKKALVVEALERFQEEFPSESGVKWSFILFGKNLVTVDSLDEVRENYDMEPQSGPNSPIYHVVHQRLVLNRRKVLKRGVPQMLIVCTDCLDNRSPAFLKQKYQNELADLTTVIVCLGPSKNSHDLPHDSFFFFGDNRDDDDDDLDKFGKRIKDYIQAHEHFGSLLEEHSDNDPLKWREKEQDKTAVVPIEYDSTEVGEFTPPTVQAKKAGVIVYGGDVFSYGSGAQETEMLVYANSGRGSTLRKRWV